MYKILIGLLTTVVLLAVALVLLNNQLSPGLQESAQPAHQSALDRLPDIPDLLADRDRKPDGPRDVKLMPLPAPPAAVEAPGTSVQAPISLDGLKHEETPGPAKAPTPEAAAAPEKAQQAGTPKAPEQTAPAPEAAAPARAEAQAPRETPREESPADDDFQDAPAKSAAAAAAPARAQSEPAAGKKPAQTGKTDEPAAKQASQGKVRPGIRIFSRASGATVRIACGRKLQYRTLLLKGPDRLMVDLTGDFPQLAAPAVPRNSMVSNIRLGRYPGRTRVVIDLRQAPGKHAVTLSSDRQSLDIRFEK